MITTWDLGRFSPSTETENVTVGTIFQCHLNLHPGDLIKNHTTCYSLMSVTVYSTYLGDNRTCPVRTTDPSFHQVKYIFLHSL